MLFELVPKEKQAETLLRSICLTREDEGYWYLKTMLEEALSGKPGGEQRLDALARERGETLGDAEARIAAALAQAEARDRAAYGRVTLKAYEDRCGYSAMQKLYNICFWLHTHEPLVPVDGTGPIRWCVRE